ncbi:MAG: 3-deoxy-D-manno-octulosonic acid transferase [bacterium]|nr:3-deoxy-D-manno-octulosonic acid transferase [bacterium]
MSARSLLYNAIILAFGILALPWVIYQLVFVKKRRQGLAQRFGRSPVMVEKTVWCHAVSVGEVRAVAPMLKLLDEDEIARGRIALSTVTVTGQETAKRECSFVKFIFYFSLDLPFVVGRAIRRINPEIFITAETEIWPNFFAACFKRDIPVIVVNGRISDSALSRYLRFRWFFRPILEKVTMFLMQSEEDARRIKEMGARPESVKVTGNMKYDRVLEPVALPDEVGRWAERGFVLVAGSTHAGEEEVVLEAIRRLEGKDLLLALVPRHPERFDEVSWLLKKEGVLFTRYSDILKGNAVDGDVVLVDAMGVLDGFYARADVAFVGGSLVPVGGHNLLEPAMHGVPVLSGPHTFNFRDIAETLTSSGGCLEVNNVEELTRAVETLAREQGTRDEMGRMAAAVSKGTKGASSENVEELKSLMKIRTSDG